MFFCTNRDISSQDSLSTDVRPIGSVGLLLTVRLFTLVMHCWGLFTIASARFCMSLVTASQAMT